MGDIILIPRFDRDELAREREVILQEIAAARDSPEDIAFDLVQDAAFPDQPVGRPILGTAESVEGFKRAPISALISPRIITAPNMVLAAAGAVDHASSWPRPSACSAALNARRRRPSPSRRAIAGGARASEKPLRADPSRAWPSQAPAYRHRGLFHGAGFAGAFGGGMSSRLFQEVRERRGLCYAIYAFDCGLSDSGHVRHPRGERTGAMRMS